MASGNVKGRTGLGSWGALAGLGTAVVGILGLAGLYPASLEAVGVLIAGLGLMLYGSTVVAGFAGFAASLPEEELARLGEAGLGGGNRSMLQAGGAAGFILGLLSLLGVASAVLPSIGVIVFGGVLLYGVSSTNRLFAISMEHATMSPAAHLLAQERLSGAVGGVVLAGAANLTLGILALIIVPSSITLTLVALLVLGVGVLAAGLASQ